MVKINKIKGLMREHGETQEDIAKLLGKTRRAVQYVFSKGKISIADLSQIAKHYNVSIADLVE